MEHNEKITLLGKATHVGTHLAEVGDKTARLKAAASRAVEDAVTKAKRFAKRSRYAAEDAEDTAHRIKHRPLRSLGLGVMARLGTDALAVWLASHKE